MILIAGDGLAIKILPENNFKKSFLEYSFSFLPPYKNEKEYRIKYS